MSVKTVKNHSEAREIRQAVRKSRLLCKKTTKELNAAFALVKAWKASPALKNSTVAQLEAMLGLASSWNGSTTLKGLSASQLKVKLKFFQEVSNNPVLKGKSSQQIKAALDTLPKREKEVRASAPVPPAVRDALKIRKEWNTVFERQRLGREGAEHALLVLSQWEKVQQGGPCKPEDVTTALELHKAWNRTPALKGKTPRDLQAAEMLFAEWNSHKALKAYTPEILSDATVQAVRAISPAEPTATITIMINDVWLGHAGMKLDAGAVSILYDPSGHYTGCFQRECKDKDGHPLSRPTDDTFYSEYGEFEWGDYLAYQLDDGPDITGYEFTIPQSQADRIKSLIKDYGGRKSMRCALTVSSLLKESGGIFAHLPSSLFPEELGRDLGKLPGVKIIRYQP